MSVILGIDPGTNITGYGIINTENNNLSYIHHEIIKTGLKNLYTTKLSLIIIDFLTETKSSSLIVDPADFEFFRVRTLNCFLFFSFKLNNSLFLDLFLVIKLHSLGFKHLILMRLNLSPLF